MNRKQRKAVAKMQQKAPSVTLDQAMALAIQHHQAGRLAEAEQLYRRIIQADPKQHTAHSNLAIALKAQGRIGEAIASYQASLALRPDVAETYYNLAITYREIGRIEEAAACNQKAISLKPGMVNAHANLGDNLKTLERLNEAEAALREALRLDPNHVQANYNLGVVHKDLGRREESLAAFARAIAVDPDFFAARLSLCMNRLPIIYRDAEDIECTRARYQADLQDLVAHCRLDSAQAILTAGNAVGLVQPFFLAYQGRNDRELQAMYGGMINRIMAARHPEFARPLPMPPLAPGEKIRVGFLSGYFRRHSNWKIPIKGWAENLDRNRFRLFGYYTDQRADDQTPVAAALFERFVQGLHTVDQWARIIHEDNLHVLIIPEVGMDPMAVRLAALRLAPVQVSSWGHPETSGMSTLDYYLSSDLMEPENGQDFYTETLVRLPNLSIHYTPVEHEKVTISREQLGIRPDAVMYWCCQSLYKYLPQFDFVFPAIGKRVPDSQFVFIDYGRGGVVNDVFKGRLRQAFADQGVPYEGRCIFLPQMDQAHFDAATALADVFLDSIGWSGCNTTFEALAHDIPVVTLPGDSMRARHSAAILRMIGITETVAGSVEDYLDLAARIGNDPAWRRAMSARVAATRHRLYGDMECIRALEDFLVRAVSERLGPAPVGAPLGPATA